MHGSHHCMSLPRPWSQRHQQFFSNKVSFYSPSLHAFWWYLYFYWYLIFVNCQLLLNKGMYFFRASSPLAQLYSTSTMEHHHFDQCIMILNSQVTFIFLIGLVFVVCSECIIHICAEKKFACRNSNHYLTILSKTIGFIPCCWKFTRWYLCKIDLTILNLNVLPSIQQRLFFSSIHKNVMYIQFSKQPESLEWRIK